MIIFKGDDRLAYRDPTCFFKGNECHLFFTVSEKDGGFMYNRVAHSKSTSLKEWSNPEFITPRDCTLNYSSPGNVIEHNGLFYICVCSYPLPQPFSQNHIANDDARLFTICTKDFVSFSEPVLLNPKSGIPCEKLGRMIDPYIIKKDDIYHLFFKQNGVSLSTSTDFKNWHCVGRTDGGENACVIDFHGEYLLIHSPQNGIAFSKSADLMSWMPHSFTTLGQAEWEWAKGRITAAFATELPKGFGFKYIMFFHGSTNVFPETHGNATLAAVFTDDFENFYRDLENEV